jgi:hypothetical protein
MSQSVVRREPGTGLVFPAGACGGPQSTARVADCGPLGAWKGVQLGAHICVARWFGSVGGV